MKNRPIVLKKIITLAILENYPYLVFTIQYIIKTKTINNECIICYWDSCFNYDKCFCIFQTSYTDKGPKVSKLSWYLQCASLINSSLTQPAPPPLNNIKQNYWINVIICAGSFSAQHCYLSVFSENWKHKWGTRWCWVYGV